MNPIFKKIIDIPFALGCRDPERISAIIKFIIYDEIENPNSPFHLNENDVADPSNRFEIIRKLITENISEDNDERNEKYDGYLCKKDYLMTWLGYVYLSHRIKWHKEIKHLSVVDELYKKLKYSEKDVPDLKEKYSADDPAIEGNWTLNPGT